MINPEPQPHHRWLQKLVGDWSYEHECETEPGKPRERVRGSERIRSLGGLWIVAEGTGDMPGGGVANTLMTLGYDPQSRRFVGTWIGSMMAYLWVYHGELDSSQRKLTLNAEGPSFAGDGKIAKYQDVIEVVSDDHRILRSQYLGEDGKWQQFMEAHYRRKG